MLLPRCIGNSLFGKHSRQLRFALILDPKFLYLRGFKAGNSLNVPSLIRHVGGIFGCPSPQVFITSWNLLISVGQLNCEEPITRISVAVVFLGDVSVLGIRFQMPCGIQPTHWIV